MHKPTQLFQAVEIDLSQPAIRNNPYPTYAELRKHSPIAKTHQFPMGDMWLITRYDDVVSLLKDDRLVNNPAAAGASGRVRDRGRVIHLVYLPVSYSCRAPH